jgi:hypothetical protein
MDSRLQRIAARKWKSRFHVTGGNIKDLPIKELEAGKWNARRLEKRNAHRLECGIPVGWKAECSEAGLRR